MAVYKKRGYKAKAIKEKSESIEPEVPSDDLESTTAEVFNTLDETANKTEEWVADNQKYIFGVVGVLALVALLVVGYQRLVQEPKEEEAANEIYQAQEYFKDAQAAGENQKEALYDLALNGGSGKLGLIDVIDQYGGTETGNIAQYYAGFSYLAKKDYKNAISHLDDFSSDDFILSALAKGGVADAFAQLGEEEKALEYYNKAAAGKANEFTTPKFLLKAAKTAIALGKSSVAVNNLEKIEIEYPKSAEYNEVETLLAKAKAL